MRNEVAENDNHLARSHKITAEVKLE